jgi:hypothetical protein
MRSQVVWHTTSLRSKDKIIQYVEKNVDRFAHLKRISSWMVTQYGKEIKIQSLMQISFTSNVHV